MPPLMFAAIVLTANHHLLDGVAGAALAVLGFVMGRAAGYSPFPASDSASASQSGSSWASR
jgi:hypothetical protein